MADVWVDWTDVLRIDGRWRYGCRCPRCGEKRYLPSYHAKHAGFCAACSNSEKSRTWHMANPSGPERRIIRQLDQMNIPYEREVRLDRYNIDFVLSKTHAIEVTSGHLHRDLCDPEREQYRFNRIREVYKLLILTDGNTSNIKKLIREFLQS